MVTLSGVWIRPVIVKRLEEEASSEQHIREIMAQVPH